MIVRTILAATVMLAVSVPAVIFADARSDLEGDIAAAYSAHITLISTDQADMKYARLAQLCRRYRDKYGTWPMYCDGPEATHDREDEQEKCLAHYRKSGDWPTGKGAPGCIDARAMIEQEERHRRLGVE